MKRFIKINLIILVIFSFIVIQSFAEENGNSTNEIEIETNQENKIDQLQLQKEQLEKQTEKFNSQLEFVNEELSAAVAEVSNLTQSILEKQTEIEELTAKSDRLSNKIKKVENQLNKVTNDYEKQKNLLEKRLVAMYEMGETSYLDLLLSSKGISDFLSNYYYISEITTTDSELLDIVKKQKEKVADLMKTLQHDKQSLEEAKSDLEKATIAISNLVIIKNQRIQTLNEEEMVLQQQVEEYQVQMQEVESEIRLLSLASDNAEYVGGIFAWPVPGYTRISSPFGMRTHPITGVYKLHTGIDISAPFGTTFVAANSGVVTKASYNAAYGNMVILDHGGGISTLYAHGSEILVEVGQTIMQGTSVLKVGSTGYSTGPHAHFEVRVDGEYANPFDYLQANEENVQNDTEVVELDSNEEI